MKKRIIAPLLWLCVIFAFSPPLLYAAGTNPGLAYFVVRGMRNGEPVDEKIYANVWLETLNGWNGKYTSKQNKIENMEFLETVNGVSQTLTFPVGTKGITEAEVNAYWDDYFSSKSRVSGPSFAMNCYGYSTGLGYWVQNTGYSKAIRDDWKQCQTMTDVVSGCTTSDGIDHAVKITEVISYTGGYYGNIRIITKTREKAGYSGVYEGVYYQPAGRGCGISSTYKKP